MTLLSLFYIHKYDTSIHSWIDLMILSMKKRPRSLSPESSNKQQRQLNTDSSMELDQTILNDAMDVLTGSTVL